jgi:hypothetical protein
MQCKKGLKRKPKENIAMIRAKIIERYIKSGHERKHAKIEEIVHETRIFSSMDKFHEWYDTFKEELWEDDKSKVDMAEGIYVKTDEVEVDNVAKPKRLRLYATFRNGVSLKYAV